MTGTEPGGHERLCELLADRALEGLGPEDELELEALIAAGHVDDPFSLATTAAVLHVSLMSRADIQPMPEHVRRRLELKGKAWARVTSQVVQSGGTSLGVPVARQARRLIWTLGPWMAAAACLILAALAWWPAQRQNTVATADHDPNHMTVQFASWNPDLKEIKGKVCWSGCEHCGYLKLRGLPANDPSREQYQLWIVDDRGMDQRISGGVFNSSGDEVVVPIRPGIAVHTPKMFAITLEPPGGTWVSDLSRKVAIAQAQ